ncbi:GNAT family N-acetyltransferase [Paenibacillus wynnii]|uniref:GNAT family N-acetyltransferase n=1 Tax=Paenibacillus wynnii TaxID=268407 RepID=UPI00278E8062|nr:GNAT family N-acetyltransferase [Paenibacillus wynnii]MDQ0196697.1 ribosomal protein S18 acetylase RimI-like enzyme [Paenibacillus wynnii]
MNEFVKLDLQDELTINELWSLQHKAYRLEAQLIGFLDIPPLLETRDMLRRSSETFYGCLSEDGDIMGAVATQEESPGKLTITRMMVDPDHFRKGIAGSLLNYVFEHYNSMEQFIVSTGKLNTPAVSLYIKHGFIAAGIEEVAPGVELIEFNRIGKLETC